MEIQITLKNCRLIFIVSNCCYWFTVQLAYLVKSLNEYRISVGRNRMTHNVSPNNAVAFAAINDQFSCGKSNGENSTSAARWLVR
jgi:hypothetical protein